MRLWHQSLLPYLPTLQFNGQHRECAALRGLGWGKNHETVNYVFTHSEYWLYLYHLELLNERKKRGYNFDQNWLNPLYRGKNCPSYSTNKVDIPKTEIIYPEHNNDYLIECINNIDKKMKIDIKKYNERDRYMWDLGKSKLF